MNCVLVVSHGSGAQLMAVGVIGRELATCGKYEEVWNICERDIIKSLK